MDAQRERTKYASVLYSSMSKVTVDNKEFELLDKDAALVLAIIELTNQIRRSGNG